MFGGSKKRSIFASQFRNKVAQMAESVDALVSNTSGFTSIPVRPRVWVQKRKTRVFLFFFVENSDVFGDHRIMDHRKISVEM